VKNHNFEGLISHIDLFPTLCDLLELEKPDHLIGKSFADVFKGDTYEGNDFIFAEINFHTSYEPARCIRTKRYKYIRFYDNEYEKLNCSNIDDSPIKDLLKEHQLLEYTKNQEALYDLLYDPMENNNIVSDARYNEALNEMRDILKEVMVSTKDPLLNGPILIKPEWKVNKKECFSSKTKDPNDFIA